MRWIVIALLTLMPAVAHAQYAGAEAQPISTSGSVSTNEHEPSAAETDSGHVDRRSETGSEATPASARLGRVARFLAGALTGLAAHESGHLATGLLFDAHPGIEGVHFGVVPFFAITHRRGLSPRREFIVSSAGFWVQHATSEWLLSRRPPLHEKRAPFAKGMLAFNVLTSVGYAATAMFEAGPAERDTRSIGATLGVSERWVAPMIAAPAALDAWRYAHPDSRWATWISRGLKIGMVALAIK